MYKDPAKSQNYSAYFLLFAIVLVIFFAVTFTFSFRDKVFQAFFQKPFSFAQNTDDSPKVDLIVGADNLFRKGVINLESGQSEIFLKWKTENNPSSCLGRFWSNVKKSDPWVGEKNTRGGDFVIEDSLQTGIYVYSINCVNEAGDASGSSIAINVGAKLNYLQPHITSFQAFGDNKQYELGKLNQVKQDTKVEIAWTGLNTQTPYGICVANGSWPTIYQNRRGLDVKESFVLDKAKIYKYSIFCSNENGIDTQEVSFLVR